MASTPDSLVLGMAAGLAPELISPFLRSLRATAYRGRVGLVLARYPPEAAAELRALADFVVVVDDRYPAPGPRAALAGLRYLRTTRRLRRTYPPAFSAVARAGRERNALARWERLEFALEGLQALRYSHYYDTLRTIAANADQILLSDVRDVLFQADPFSSEVAPLEVFLEEPTVTIGTEPFNGRWIKRLYGPSTFAAISDAVASCSGTVAGHRAEIMHYLKEMTNAISWRRVPLGNHDQGVHNWLLRSGRLGTPKIVANGTGRVLTMGAMPHVERRADGAVLNPDDSVPAVLHQYDRHPPLAAELLARLGQRPSSSADRGNQLREHPREDR